MTRKVLIVPCSGIGKSYGTVARESAFALTEDLRPDNTHLLPLSLVVLGDGEVRADLCAMQAIAIDGCKLACAAKVVAESGGNVAHKLQVLDVYRRHRRFKPSGIAELNEQGQALAQVLAEEVSRLVDIMTTGEENHA
jgi:uncharacterized metal-binding protein